MGQRLGRFIGQYRNTYFQPDKRNGMIVYSYKPLPGAEDAIYEKISDITVSMRATDHLKMPELIMSEYTVQLSEAEHKKYSDLRQELVLSLPDCEVTAANAASLSNKLSQMANGAIYDDSGEVIPIHDRKLDALEDIIESMNGRPLLVAYWFRHDLDRISERLHQLHIPFSTLDKSDSISRWNNGELPVALIHPASAGHAESSVRWQHPCMVRTDMESGIVSADERPSVEARTAVSDRCHTAYRYERHCR